METINILNMPKEANNYEFVVITEQDKNTYLFHGAYADGFMAEQEATLIHGLILHNVRIQGYKDNE